MKKTISQLLGEGGSVYISATKDGSGVIRVSGHLPDPDKLCIGDVTKNCKNIFLILVRSQIVAQIRRDGAKLAELVRSIDSNNPVEKKLGEMRLNNLIAEIGYDAKKGMNYQIIDGNSEHEIKAAIKAVTKMLKTSVFKPLEYKQD
jgi:hypothetical protein